MTDAHTSALPPERAAAVADRWAARLSRPTLERLARSVGEAEVDRAADAPAVAHRALRRLQREGLDRLCTLPPGNRELWRAAVGEAGDLLAVAGRALLDAAAAAPLPPSAAALAADPPADDRPRIPVLAGSCRWEEDYTTLLDPLQVHLREVAAQVEVGRVLAETRAAKVWLPAGWKNTPDRTRARFAALLEGPDCTRAGLRARAWPILATLGDLAAPVSAACLEPTEAGRALAAVPPREALRRLLRAWLEHPEYDELESALRQADPRPPVECVQRWADRRLRRRLLVAAVRSLPVGRWVPVAPYVDHLVENGLLPVAAEQVWPPYFAGATVRPIRSMSATDLDGEPLRLRLPVLLVALAEVLATLGVLDVAFIARGPGVVRARSVVAPWTPVAGPHAALAYVRLTDLGAWMLDPLAEAPSAARTSEARLDALADLLVG